MSQVWEFRERGIQSHSEEGESQAAPKPPERTADVPGGSDVPVTARIAYHLHQFNSASNRYADVFAETHDLHKTDLQALASLIEAARRGHSMNAGELSAQLHLSAPATTALLDRMSRMGHLRRRRNDFDRRIVDIHVSPDAIALGGQLFEPIARRTGRVIADFAAEDQAVIERFLIRVREAVQAAHDEVAHSDGDHSDSTSEPGNGTAGGSARSGVHAHDRRTK